MIGLPIGDSEGLLGWKIPVEGIILKEFMQSDDSIAVCVVECVVDIYEEVSNLFHII